jgi:alkaline phosphatase D
VHATWDDHDYGRNDAGADYPMRAQSERIFVDFFDFPEGSPVRSRPGIYSAHSYGPVGRRIQIILLDTRSFRSPLQRAGRTTQCSKGRYVPNESSAATLLGESQWSWLEYQLRKAADIRVIVSSIQVIPDGHCFEKWGNFPRERRRLFEEIAQSGAGGVVLISGDRHFAEISRLDGDAIGYPLYEVTSSGMNSAGKRRASEPNPYRVSRDNFRQENFGVIEVDWSLADPQLRLQIRDVSGKIVDEQGLRLSELRAEPTQAAAPPLVPALPLRR